MVASPFSVPEEFNYDPVSKTYGEPQRRPEIRSSTIEFIAPSEYMVRVHNSRILKDKYSFVVDFLVTKVCVMVNTS